VYATDIPYSLFHFVTAYIAQRISSIWRWHAWSRQRHSFGSNLLRALHVQCSGCQVTGLFSYYQAFTSSFGR